MTLRQEKAHLEAQLADIPVAQQRLEVSGFNIFEFVVKVYQLELNELFFLFTGGVQRIS